MVSNKHIVKFSAILTSIIFVLCIAVQIYPDMLSSFVTDILPMPFTSGTFENHFDNFWFSEVPNG